MGRKLTLANRGVGGCRVIWFTAGERRAEVWRAVLDSVQSKGLFVTCGVASLKADKWGNKIIINKLKRRRFKESFKKTKLFFKTALKISKTASEGVRDEDRCYSWHSQGLYLRFMKQDHSIQNDVGVTFERLRTLTLFGNRFKGNIPDDYADLHTLWKINSSSNALSGSIPEFIGDLPNIRFLDLSKNGFNGEIPSALFVTIYKNKDGWCYL
ncbi:hypothetical protein Ahy_A04g021619 [Arachis hypogaea]|uniref:Uncharacterized protein n=1 Tax=Arachis hypogaea TaxID=3818 RepID=A0A445DLF5_ARAHY|nr:hypothetical protein Ahy_A04g021619 [Arachis hypogaea]